MNALPDCICFNLRKAARAVSRIFDEELARVDLKNTQFSLLANLAALSPVAVTELAERVVMDRTTLSRNLVPLERDGLLRVDPGEDRRQRVVSLTTAGARKLRSAMPLWERAHGRIDSHLSSARQDRMRRDLRSVVDAVSE
jgi:DNA-binding MarR family transcriptional regulator